MTKQGESSEKVPHLGSSVWFPGGAEALWSLKTTLVATGFNLKSYIINNAIVRKLEKKAKQARKQTIEQTVIVHFVHKNGVVLNQLFLDSKTM